MVVVSIIAALILFFSLINGFKDGALKQAVSFISFLIAIPLTGLCYHWLARLFSFIPGENWENFLGFIITIGIMMVILYFIFLALRRHFEKSWKEGPLFRLIGAALGFLNAGIGMVLFALVLNAYPIFDWLQRAVSSSDVISWLGSWLGFIQYMLPSVFR
jgi:uncharacterized membrane protein required for colicin V production